MEIRQNVEMAVVEVVEPEQQTHLAVRVVMVEFLVEVEEVVVMEQVQVREEMAAQEVEDKCGFILGNKIFNNR
jgi:hypothetical protein